MRGAQSIHLDSSTNKTICPLEWITAHHAATHQGTNRHSACPNKSEKDTEPPFLPHPPPGPARVSPMRGDTVTHVTNPRLLDSPPAIFIRIDIRPTIKLQGFGQPPHRLTAHRMGDVVYPCRYRVCCDCAICLTVRPLITTSASSSPN